jgi:hypothetical protein
MPPTCMLKIREVSVMQIHTEDVDLWDVENKVEWKSRVVQYMQYVMYPYEL